MEEYEGEGVLQGSEWDADQLLSDLADAVRRARLYTGPDGAIVHEDGEGEEGMGRGLHSGLIGEGGGKEEGRRFKHRLVSCRISGVSLSSSLSLSLSLRGGSRPCFLPRGFCAAPWQMAVSRKNQRAPTNTRPQILDCRRHDVCGLPNPS